MKNSTYKNLSEILRTKGVLGVAAGLLLVSCGSQMGGYTETDGVYYDPNKDVIPEGIVMPEPNQVNEVYAYESDSASIIEQNQQNQAAQKNKYQTWNGTESDWGTYAGTEQNIYYNNYNTWGWNPYGYYSPYYGWGNGWNIGIGFGWNNWGWNNWGWNPYWDPYFGYGGYGYYNPRYGYYSPYYGGYYGYNPYYYGGYYYPRNNYKRSGADAITRGNGFQNSNNRSFNNRMNTNNSNNSGFRTTPPRNTNPNMTQPPQNSNPSRFRSVPRQEPRQYEAPRQEPRRNDWGGSSNSGGGFRSGGSSSSSGSSSSGGGFRSGGFR